MLARDAHESQNGKRLSTLYAVKVVSKDALKERLKGAHDARRI